MHVIGIVGGVASGKSLVAEQFRRLGAVVLSADALGHEVLRQPDVKQAIQSRWGSAVFDKQGEVDRAAVADIVFASTPEAANERAFLEQLTHGRIGQRLQDAIDERVRGGDTDVVVVDAALLFESGWHKLCTTTVFVDASRELRLARAKHRGWSDAEFSAREAAQDSLERKRDLSDVVIDNSGAPEATGDRVRRFWQTLVSQ
jgi:dephospho-CoA kinase